MWGVIFDNSYIEIMEKYDKLNLDKLNLNNKGGSKMIKLEKDTITKNEVIIVELCEFLENLQKIKYVVLKKEGEKYYPVNCLTENELSGEIAKYYNIGFK